MKYMTVCLVTHPKQFAKYFESFLAASFYLQSQDNQDQFKIESCPVLEKENSYFRLRPMDDNTEGHEFSIEPEVLQLEENKIHRIFSNLFDHKFYGRLDTYSISINPRTDTSKKFDLYIRNAQLYKVSEPIRFTHPGPEFTQLSTKFTKPLQKATEQVQKEKTTLFNLFKQKTQDLNAAKASVKALKEEVSDLAEHKVYSPQCSRL